MDAIKTTAAGITVNHVGLKLQWSKDVDGQTVMHEGTLESARHYRRGKASMWVELRFSGVVENTPKLIRVRPKAVFHITTRYTT